MTDEVSPRPELMSLYAEEIGALAAIERFIDENISARSIETPKTEISGIILWFLGGRATKAFRAIRLLCEQGYGTEAVIIARTLLETLLSMRFIQETNSEKRARAYVDHDWKFKERFSKFTSGLSEIQQKLTAEQLVENEQRIKVQAKVAKEEHGFSDGTGALCWTGENITALGDRFEMSFHVRAFYQMAAQHAHVLAGSASEFVRHIEGQGFGWQSGPGTNYVAETAVTSCDLMISVLKILDQRFGFDLEDEINTLDKALAETLKTKKMLSNQLDPSSSGNDGESVSSS